MHTVYVLLAFGVIALASRQIGAFFGRIHLPQISGYLFTGILVSSFVLGMLEADISVTLRFVDQIALSFIAFAAGSELHLSELRGNLRSIGIITAGLTAATFTLGATAIYFLAGYIPLVEAFGPTGRLAVALLGGAIMVARSPSGLIAIINELRATGPFTRIALGVTVIMDVGVIVLFAISDSIAAALLEDLAIQFDLLLLLLFELLAAVGLGLALAALISFVLRQNLQAWAKAGMLLIIGYATFFVSDEIVLITHDALPFEIHLEPLLICLVAGFTTNNWSPNRAEFKFLIEEAGPPIFVVFFTLIGASLQLDILLEVWPIALALFLTRIVGITVGTYAGGIIAGTPAAHNRVRWMAFVTQAGVAIGLASQIDINYAPWGSVFATTIIAVVVLNELVGPILIKAAIQRVGEAHQRAPLSSYDGERNAVIFGLSNMSLALARQLLKHDWQVVIATRLRDRVAELDDHDVIVAEIPDLSLETLQTLPLDHAEEVVLMLLDDDENYDVCAKVYEHFGVRDTVVYVRSLENVDRFRALGAIIVEAQTALVSLLEQMVRAPVSTSILLGRDEYQDLVDFELRNAAYEGVAIRDLGLPIDVLMLAVHRDGHHIVSHGYTRLLRGDKMTLIGPREQLEDLRVQFEVNE